MGMKRALYTNKNIENLHWNDVKHGNKQQNSTISTFSFDFYYPDLFVPSVLVIVNYLSDTIMRVYKHSLQVFLNQGFFSR